MTTITAAVAAAAALGLTIAHPTVMVLRPAGPGLWALIGAPAFTALIIRSGPERPVAKS